MGNLDCFQIMLKTLIDNRTCSNQRTLAIQGEEGSQYNWHPVESYWIVPSEKICMKVGTETTQSKPVKLENSDLSPYGECTLL